MDTLQQVVCQHCNAINRVPGAGLANAPSCGKCHKPLFTARSLQLASGSLQRYLKGNSLPVLTLFWAPWCGYCQKTLPVFQQVASRLEPFFRLAQVNTEENPAVATQYAINSLPTMILFRQGREAARQAGALSAEQIIAWARRGQA